MVKTEEMLDMVHRSVRCEFGKRMCRLFGVSVLFVFVLLVGIAAVSGAALADGETVDNINFCDEKPYSGPSQDITVTNYVTANSCAGIVDITVRSIGLGNGTTPGTLHGSSTEGASVWAESATIKIGGSYEDSRISAVKSDQGTVYGVYTSGSGGVSICDVDEITASGEGWNMPGFSSTKVGVCAYSIGTLNVTNAKKISGEISGSKKGDAIGVWARESLDGDNSTVTLTNVQEITATVSNNNSASYGIKAEDNGIVNLNNVGTVTASGGTASYSAYVNTGGTLNVSTDTTTTFNGDIYNAGTISGDNIVVLNGGIKNDGGSVDITIQSVSTDSGVEDDDSNCKVAVLTKGDGAKTIIGKSGTNHDFSVF